MTARCARCGRHEWAAYEDERTGRVWCSARCMAADLAVDRTAAEKPTGAES